MSHETWEKTFTCLRILIWTCAVVATAQVTLAQSSPPLPGNPFGLGAMIPPDPAAIKQRWEAEMETCRNLAETVDVYEKVDCKTLDALLKLSQGQNDAGFSAFRESLAMLEGVGDRFGIATTQLIMAELAKTLQRSAEAFTAYESALANLAEARQSSAPFTLKSFALFVRLGGLPEQFLEMAAGPMMQLMRPMMIDQMELMARVSLAAFLLTQERHAEAEPHLQAARPLSRNLFGMMDGPVLNLLGQVRERQGRLDEARAVYEEALAAAQRSGDTALRLEIQARLDRLRGSEPPPAPVPRKEPEKQESPPDSHDQAEVPEPVVVRGQSGLSRHRLRNLGSLCARCAEPRMTDFSSLQKRTVGNYYSSRGFRLAL